jgi:serine/threonine-protein kinase
MLAGAPPFTGPTSQAVMARHTSDAVPPLTTLRAIPPALESTIVRALAKAPADRWPTAQAFAESLERAIPAQPSGRVPATATGRSLGRLVALGGGAVAFVVVAVLALRTLRGTDPRAGLEDDSIRSLAVRPFSYSGDSASAIYALGMADGILPA